MSIVTTNVGSADRIARIVVGLALIVFALVGPAEITWKWIGWIGVVPILTAFLKWCPAYTILGVNTCGR
jgi:hypothetical protein